MYCNKCVKRAVIARTWVEDVVLSYVLAYHNREDGFKPGGGANGRKSSASSAQTGFALFFYHWNNDGWCIQLFYFKLQGAKKL